MADHLDLRGWFFRIIYILRRRINLFLLNLPAHFLCFLEGIRVGKRVRFYGLPTIHRYPNSVISIGNGCIFNSSKNSVPARLSKPNVLVTLNKDARITIGNYSGSSGSTIIAANSISIGNNVMIGANCTIIYNDLHNTDPSKRDLYNKETIPSNPVVIGDNVFLGFDCTVLKGVSIGDNSVIGANSVVLKSIPPNSIALGNPCKVIFKRNWKE
jgi:acetyltransferase-like isoleucine patch superfamily enzyme